MSTASRFGGKELILSVLTVAAGLANAYLWRGLLFAGEFKDAAFYSLPVVALFLFAILFALSSAFIRQRWLRNVTAALSLGVGYLFSPYSSFILGGLGLSMLGGWYAASVISAEERASSKFSVRKILRGGLPVFFTSVALLLAILYFSSIRGEQRALFPRSLFDAAIPFLEQPLQAILPGFRRTASVDELLLALTAQQLGETIDVSGFPPASREALLEQGRKTLSVEFGVNLTGKEKMTDVLYRVTNSQIAKFLGPYQSYLPIIAAAGFFVAVKALTLPVYWITLILVFGVVKLLVATGLLKQRTETIQVTKFTL